ncbi:Nn.00g001070.m01.CDS01 [Neocucurbitaria sp. VM-36]
MFPPALRPASRLRPRARLVTTLPLAPKKRNLYFCGPKASNRDHNHDHNPLKPTPKHYIAGVGENIVHLESVWKRGGGKVTEETNVQGKPVQEVVKGIDVIVPVLEDGDEMAKVAGSVESKVG